MAVNNGSALALGRSPHGERGLKLHDVVTYGDLPGRSPHGERGLKSVGVAHEEFPAWSLSSWRAWIEIEEQTANVYRPLQVALLMESVD